MNFFQLRAFCAVAACSSFSRAAEELFTSQSHLSKTVASLETELDVTLFHRGRNAIRLTGAGEVLLPWAKEVLRSRDETLLHLSRFQLHKREGLSIAVSSSLAYYNLLAPIQQFCPNGRKVPVYLFEYEKDSILKYLDAGTVDLAVTWMEEPETAWLDYSPYRVHPLLRDRRCLLVSRNHPFSGRTSLLLSEAAGEQFVFPENRHQLEIYTELCRGSGFEPEIAARYASIPTQLQLVSQNFGVSIALAGMADRERFPELRAVPLEPASVNTLAIIERKSDSSALAQSFIGEYSAYVRKRYGPAL